MGVSIPGDLPSDKLTVMRSYLQSERWEAFQRACGYRTIRVGDTLLIGRGTPVGTYWYAARPEHLDLAALQTYAQTDRSLFVRIDPSEPIATEAFPTRPTLATQPQDSLVLDLGRSEEELLGSFHEKTRYNIRLSQKRGVSIEESTDVSAFLALARGTADRQAFRYHTGQYYQTMLETLRVGELKASLLVAKAAGRPVAALILLITPDTAYYLHGASSYADRALMAPHLLQWAAILKAKEQGCQAYDFWGIAPPIHVESGNFQFPISNFQFDPNHPWAGVTRFKLGFGGEVVHYPDSFDLVLQPAAYTVYTMGRRLRRALPF
ncbi:peptidoglycan bridge formation glycyltransferase FemA/FemB family protein [Candidatus Berkelbacteria bacterium]|nr:peptidoglycan bridge formation glycyltransferase FemA/FemB family protein [Candidatus Berkelbacteria bacterium]